MTCHCDFKEDCCCQENTQSPKNPCRCLRICLIAAGILALSTASIFLARRYFSR